VEYVQQVLQLRKLIACGVAAGADAQCGRSARARIASIVVGRPELFAEWNDEMGMMAGRIRVRPRASLLPASAY